MDEIREGIARAIRRDKFARNGRLAALDETIPLTDGDYSEAAAALSYLASSGIALVPVEATEATHEEVARLIYNTWAWHPEFVPWVVRGNSDKQYEARSHARAVYRATLAASPFKEKNDDAGD